MKRLAASLFTALLLSACAVSPRVVTTTTTFYVPDFHASGILVVLPVNKELENSLEFAHYKRVIESKLAEHGYSISQNVAEADFFAYVSYGIDDGTQSQVAVPLFGKTGGGTTTYSSGTARTTGGGGLTGLSSTTIYSGSSYTMPTYGLIGVTSVTRTTYRRAVALDIIDIQSSMDTGNTKKVFEARAFSLGTCSRISEVLDEILEGMFENFPGENGKSHQSRINGQFNC